MKLYHGSNKKINSFIKDKPMWFSSRKEDVIEAIGSQTGYSKNKGYIYCINVKEFETTSDYWLFHSGEIFNTVSSNVVKMNSNDLDNNWFVIKDITKFKCTLL